MSTLMETAEPRTTERKRSSWTGVADAPASERRSSVRRRGGAWASLVTLDGNPMLSCAVDDIGEGGLHVTSPVGYGFAVGQRYEVLLSRGNEPSAESDFLGEGHYATIVRTKFMLDRPEAGDGMGIGMRFDQPVVL